MIESQIVLETIQYILHKIGQTDKIKIVKLVYLSDKLHLLRYGRTITGDDYYAMKHGPVGTTIKDILDDIDSYKEFIIRVGKNEYKCGPKLRDFDGLSDTDKESLDFVIAEFGKMDKWKLRDYTHQYPEWKQYELLFKKQLTGSERINTEELFSTIPNDRLKVTKDRANKSKKIFLG